MAALAVNVLWSIFVGFINDAQSAKKDWDVGVCCETLIFATVKFEKIRVLGL